MKERACVLVVVAAVLAACFAVSTGFAAGEPGAGRDDAAEVIEEANTFFQRANEAALTDPGLSQDLYGQAALKFEYATGDLGVRNSELYGNLANTYFLLGDFGRSILGYRRALRYDPGNRELAESLEHARTQAVDVFPLDQPTQLWRGMFFWHYHWTTTTAVAAFVVAYLALWVLVTVWLFVREERIGWGIAWCAAISVLLAGSLVIRYVDQSRHPAGVITDAEVIARKGDGFIYDSALTNTLHSGTEFQLMERRGDWLFARFSSGETAWLPAASVGLVEEE